MSTQTNIVMLVKNRNRLTTQALSSLYTNTPHDQFNLTIVDDQSLEITRYLIAKGTELQHIASQNICVLRNEISKGITGQARNLGVYWAEKYWGRGDWLYLTDNDVFFTPGWLDTLYDVAKRMAMSYGHFAVGGWNHPYLQPACPVRADWQNHIGIHDALAGASQLMRWSTWDQYGPLDAHAPGVGQSEDWAFCQKIIKDGGRVGSIYPRVVLNCGLTNSHGQPSPGADLMLQELQEAKRQYPDLYWE